VIDLGQSFCPPGFPEPPQSLLQRSSVPGITDDLGPGAFGGNIIYSFLMPMGALAVETLGREEIGAVMEMAILELLKTGTTTVLDIWRLDQEFFSRSPKTWGYRAYGLPYLFSTPGSRYRPRRTADVPQESGRGDGISAGRVELFGKYDEGPEGRIRVGFGPHGVDSCDPIASSHQTEGG